MNSTSPLLDLVIVCAACRDPEAAPRAVQHESGNPWQIRLVCAKCGDLRRGGLALLADLERRLRPLGTRIEAREITSRRGGTSAP